MLGNILYYLFRRQFTHPSLVRRASLHEEFGRKLMKHAKVGMGREETGYVRFRTIVDKQKMFLVY